MKPPKFLIPVIIVLGVVLFQSASCVAEIQRRSSDSGDAVRRAPSAHARRTLFFLPDFRHNIGKDREQGEASQ